jgi:hypothetical protein
MEANSDEAIGWHYVLSIFSLATAASRKMEPDDRMET